MLVWSDMRSLVPSLSLLILAAPAAAQQALSAEQLVEGLNNPLFVTHAPGDDASRIFVVTHWGRLRIVENDAINTTPFLDISHLRRFGGEEGQNCMAFHPDYQNNRKFYVTYCDLNGDWVLAQYLRDPLDPNLADPNSGQIVLTIPHPSTIHYSGWMEFGPDGYLYVAVGDGADQGDPLNHSQRGDLLLGKLLRLDMDNPSPGLLYGIPPGNPYVNDPNFRDEIWAVGLRNPWRCDVDDLTGDIWIGDVGYNTWEEVDFLAAGVAGANFGWRLMEGNHCHNPAVNCDPGGLTHPVHEWQHGGSPFRCSVTGGQVYRGRAMADMQGRFFFADYCSGEVWSLRWDGQQAVDFLDHTADLAPVIGSDPSITGFGTDADGEIYIGAQGGGKVFRIIPAGLRLAVPQLTAGNAAVAAVRSGAASAPVALLYSLAGLGATDLPRLGVTLSLDRPRLAAAAVTDALGEASFAATVPLALQHRSIWFQAVQRGAKSNVVLEEVE